MSFMSQGNTHPSEPDLGLGAIIFVLTFCLCLILIDSARRLSAQLAEELRMIGRL